MTLDCPGCKSKLKLDPAKLPPGATTAVCPKCRTKILLPGSTGAEEITVQCDQCSSRLKVKVARLKPTASKSKCPKCGGQVGLPAAPAGGGGSATRMMPSPQAQPSPSRPGGPPPGVDKSAMTRRLDAREMGVLLGGDTGEGRAPSRSRRSQPIADDGPPSGAMESSSADLGKLIDERVDALGAEPPRPALPPPRMGESSFEDLAIEMPPSREPDPAQQEVTTGRPFGAEAPATESPASRPAPAGAPRRPVSGPDDRAVPTFSAVAGPADRAAGRGRPMASLLGGIVGGSIVAAALVLGGQYLPAGMAPPVPEAIAALTGGPSLGLLVMLVALSALSGFLAGIAHPPEGSGGGVSLFRCAVAAGLVGLLAGVGISLMRGGSEIAAMAMPVASWTLSLVAAGLLAGLVARIFAR